jgi:pyrroline-5-carboxylate reductase
MNFWKRLWAFLLNETTIDEKIAAKVTKVKKEVAEVKEAVEKVVEEAKDVVVAVKPKKKRYYKPKAKKQ